MGALEAQVAAYQSVARDEELSLGLVDSAFVARDLSSPRCRRFNAALGCAWFDEIACYSDRDQLSFPYALRRLGLAASTSTASTTTTSTSRGPGKDPVFFRRQNADPIALVVPPGRPFKGQGPAFHWYYTHALAVGKCLACVRDRTDALAGDLALLPRSSTA